MCPDVQSTQLHGGALDEAAALQARAFFDDPLVGFVLPSDEARRRCLPSLMRAVLAYGSQHGHVYTGATSMLGHAVWLPPGRSRIAVGSIEPVIAENMRRQVGDLAFGRFASVLEQTALARAYLVPEPHWDLMLLGVDPIHQREGVAGALLQPILTCADVEHLSCFAVTANDRSLAFFQRHGFNVSDEQRIPDRGPLVWMLIRNPKRPDRHRSRSHLERGAVGAAQRVRR